MRDLLGLDKALQRMQVELVNGTSKLTALEQDISRNKRKLEESETEHQKQHIKECLTLVSVLTAIEITIATLVLALLLCYSIPQLLVEVVIIRIKSETG